MDLNQYLDWQAAKPGRSVKIDIQSKIYPHDKENEVKVWVYSTKLGEGQFVQSVDEIDLAAKARERELAKLAELQAKYCPNSEEKEG